MWEVGAAVCRNTRAEREESACRCCTYPKSAASRSTCKRAPMEFQSFIHTQALQPRWPDTSVKTAKTPKSAFIRVLKIIGVMWLRVPKSLFHRANPGFAPGKSLKPGFCIVQKTVLEPENSFRTVLAHSWAFWLFRRLCQTGRVASQALVKLCCWSCLTLRRQFHENSGGLHPKFLPARSF